MKMKKFMALLLAAVMTVSILTGCSSSSTDNTSDSENVNVSETNEEEVETSDIQEEEETEEETVADTMEIVDLDGNIVTVPTPENLKGFIITDPKGAIEAAALLGVVDKVMSAIVEDGLLLNAYPDLADLPSYSDFGTVNAEEILQADPDFVIVGGPTYSTKEELESLGVTVVVDGVTVEDSDDVFETNNSEIRLIAELTGTEDKAELYFDWADEIYDLVAQRVADIPQEERVRFLTQRSSMTNIYGDNCIYSYVSVMAGGYNVSGDITEGLGGTFFVDVDPEVVVEYNPEVIFVTMGATSSSYEEWASDERYANMTAILEGNVYQIPTGIGLWNQSIESPLCVLWMAKIMYPDLFEDIDVKEVANEFYLKFFGYTPTDEDWADIAWQFDGANSNGLSD